MNIELNDLLKHSCVISIDDKRHQAFKMHFKEFSIIPKRFDGFKMQTEQYNGNDYKLPALNQPILSLSFTHASIVKMAKFLDWPFVCIFEDDACPCENAISKMKYYLQEIPDNAAILKFGTVIVYKHSSSVISNRFILGQKNWGSHAYVVFRSHFCKYLDIFQKHIICDHEVFNDSENILITKENIFIQKNIDANTIGKVKRG